MAQKVISVNIDTFVNSKESKGYKENEFEIVNKYLTEGYQVTDKFSTVPISENGHCINITFVLTNPNLR
jgi:hypothetical protein